MFLVLYQFIHGFVAVIMTSGSIKAAVTAGAEICTTNRAGGTARNRI